jgi:hypothetical protein
MSWRYVVETVCTESRVDVDAASTRRWQRFACNSLLRVADSKCARARTGGTRTRISSMRAAVARDCCRIRRSYTSTSQSSAAVVGARSWKERATRAAACIRTCATFGTRFTGGSVAVVVGVRTDEPNFVSAAGNVATIGAWRHLHELTSNRYAIRLRVLSSAETIGDAASRRTDESAGRGNARQRIAQVRLAGGRRAVTSTRRARNEARCTAGQSSGRITALQHRQHHHALLKRLTSSNVTARIVGAVGTHGTDWRNRRAWRGIDTRPTCFLGASTRVRRGSTSGLRCCNADYIRRRVVTRKILTERYAVSLSRTCSAAGRTEQRTRCRVRHRHRHCRSRCVCGRRRR